MNETEPGDLGPTIARLENKLDEVLLRLAGPPSTGKVSIFGGLLEFDVRPFVTLEQMETAYILYVLDKCGQNKTAAAEFLGVDPSTLYRKLSRLTADADPA